MKAYLFYIIISLLVLTIPIFVIGLLGTAVTEKYQIEHARMFIEMDADEQTIEKTKKELKEVDVLENEIRMTQNILISMTIVSLISIILLFVYRNKIIKTKTQQHV